jgi:hypothetical protein
MTAAIARELRTIDMAPRKGQRILTVNLAGLDVGQLWQDMKAMGFISELIHLRFSPGTVQAHALLWEGVIDHTPDSLDDQLDELWGKYGTAVHYAAGQSQAEYRASAGVG